MRNGGNGSRDDGPVDGPDRTPVDRLIDAMVDGVRLPTAEISALHQIGHDVRIRNGGDRVVALLAPRPDERLRSLTRREREVAGRVAIGETNRQVARSLGISLATVKDHVHAILSKTGLQSRSELVAAWYGGLGSHTTGEHATGPCSSEVRP